MDYSYDSTGIDPDKKGGGKLVPEGWHLWRIKKAEPTKSKSGNFMVKLECEIINNIDLMGKTLPHWVTFLPKDKQGAGIAIHFLKVIGQPWEGKFNVVVADWVGGEFRGRTEDQPFTSQKDGKEYTSSKIVEVDYVKEDEGPLF